MRFPGRVLLLLVIFLAVLATTMVASSGRTSAQTSSTAFAAVPSGSSVPDDSIPAGKGRTAPGSQESGTTLPSAPGTYRLASMGRADQPLAVVIRSFDSMAYVVEKTGRVRPLRNGKAEAPVLDLSPVVSTTNEQGLLGLVFHPTDPTRLFVDYTDRRGAVTVSEFTTNKPLAGQPIAVDGGSQRVLLKIAKPLNEHNAGTIVFDRTGALLIGIGDGGGSGDPGNNAQRTDVLLGKVLRILPDPRGTKPYGIPTDNPFAAAAAPVLGSNRKPTRPEIFAFGLRNPWRLSVDRATGDVWVPDVGQSKVEEINRVPKGIGGQNFGWRNREGTSPYTGGRPPKAVEPVHAYAHADGRCAVVGGFVYRGKALPALVGWYLFADVCSGELMALDPRNSWRATSLGITLSYPTAFAETADGEPLIMSFEGPIARLTTR